MIKVHVPGFTIHVTRSSVWKFPDTQALCATALEGDRRGDFQILCDFFTVRIIASWETPLPLWDLWGTQHCLHYPRNVNGLGKVKGRKKMLFWFSFPRNTLRNTKFVKFQWNLSKAVPMFLLFGSTQLVSTLEKDKAVKDEFLFFTVSPCIYK